MEYTEKQPIATSTPKHLTLIRSTGSSPVPPLINKKEVEDDEMVSTQNTGTTTRPLTPPVSEAFRFQRPKLQILEPSIHISQIKYRILCYISHQKTSQFSTTAYQQQPSPTPLKFGQIKFSKYLIELLYRNGQAQLIHQNQFTQQSLIDKQNPSDNAKIDGIKKIHCERCNKLNSKENKILLFTQCSDIVVLWCHLCITSHVDRCEICSYFNPHDKVHQELSTVDNYISLADKRLSVPLYSSPVPMVITDSLTQINRCSSNGSDSHSGTPTNLSLSQNSPIPAIIPTGVINEYASNFQPFDALLSAINFKSLSSDINNAVAATTSSKTILSFDSSTITAKGDKFKDQSPMKNSSPTNNKICQQIAHSIQNTFFNKALNEPLSYIRTNGKNGSKEFQSQPQFEMAVEEKWQYKNPEISTSNEDDLCTIINTKFLASVFDCKVEDLLPLLGNAFNEWKNIQQEKVFDISLTKSTANNNTSTIGISRKFIDTFNQTNELHLPKKKRLGFES